MPNHKLPLKVKSFNFINNISLIIMSAKLSKEDLQKPKHLFARISSKKDFAHMLINASLLMELMS
jgi:hypothetical protein